MEKRIIKNIGALGKQEQMKVLTFLHKKHVKISTCADGSRINLTGMDKDLLGNLDDFIGALVLIQNLTMNLI
jgi:hypothetical protein